METHLVPLVQWDSTYQAVLATFHRQLGQSEAAGGRFRQWTRKGFTAFMTGQRADYDPPAREDSVGAVIVGYSIAKARRCRHP
jgi:hypothetical protein